MRQLSGHDAGHLYTDTVHSNANVSLLHIYDQRTAPGGVVRFKSILAHMARRLHGAPLFRQRLQRVPLGLDHPYWVDDEHFDLEYHVRHIALPKPGDWRQFCIQASRIHARALDMDRPLWEAYVIEGLDSLLDLPVGSFALLLKTHLSAVDLGGLGALTTLLHDVDANPPPDGPPQPWFADSAPGRVALVAQGLARSARAPLRLARPLVRAALQAAPAAVALASDAVLRPDNLPVTRFNAVVSPHRIFETRRFSEAELAEVCRLVPGANVDDVVLAVCGGALRRYLDDEGELPEGHSLSAIVPVVQGVADDANGLAWRHVRLGTHLADPAQRLAAVRDQRLAAPDAVARALGQRALAAVADQASAALLAWTRRVVGAASAHLGRRAPPANCSVTTVPAPAQPQYLCGARLAYTSAMLPIADGLGLAFAVTHYDGRIVISPTACRELVPDPERLAQCLRDSLQDLLALARALPPAAKLARKAPRKTTSKTTSQPRQPAAPRVAPKGSAAPATAAAPGASWPGTPRRARRPA